MALQSLEVVLDVQPQNVKALFRKGKVNDHLSLKMSFLILISYTVLINFIVFSFNYNRIYNKYRFSLVMVISEFVYTMNHQFASIPYNSYR